MDSLPLRFAPAGNDKVAQPCALASRHGHTLRVITELVPVTSIGKARRFHIEVAGTSPAMTGYRSITVCVIPGGTKVPGRGSRAF